MFLFPSFRDQMHLLSAINTLGADHSENQLDLTALIAIIKTGESTDKQPRDEVRSAGEQQRGSCCVSSRLGSYVCTYKHLLTLRWCSQHLLHLHPVLCKLLEPARPANFLYESLFLGSLVEEDGCGMRKGLSGHIQFWGLK